MSLVPFVFESYRLLTGSIPSDVWFVMMEIDAVGAIAVRFVKYLYSLYSLHSGAGENCLARISLHWSK